LDGRAIRIDLANAPSKERPPRSSGRVEAPTSAASNTLFIGNISFNSDENSIRNAFSQYGNVVSVRLPTDRETGQMKG